MRDAVFVDANIFIRYLVIDNEEKAERCRKLFEKAVKGEIKLFSTTLVIAEIIWVLSKVYNWRKEETCKNIKLILNTPNIKFVENPLLRRAINRYAANNIDFIDAYHAEVVLSKEINTLYSYDKDFDNFSDLRRLEP
ncbi:MAG: PIN domain-containing protein [Actinobacteria bacterium]|nr:PIN domain-containing protein [Actinomycetota bacterium]